MSTSNKSIIEHLFKLTLQADYKFISAQRRKLDCIVQIRGLLNMSTFFSNMPREFNYQNKPSMQPVELWGRSKKTDNSGSTMGNWDKLIEKGDDFTILGQGARRSNNSPIRENPGVRRQ